MSALRAAFLCGALCACATGPALPQMRGCWIERRADDVTVTMRWFPNEVGGWRGAMVRYAPGAEPEVRALSVDETITVSGGQSRNRSGFDLCIDGARCETLTPERGHALSWAEITATEERLRMVFYREARAEVLFDGVRDGCD